MRNNIIILALVSVLLSGCFWKSVPKIEVVKTEIERTPLNLPNTPAPKMEELKWIIIKLNCTFNTIF